MFKFKALEVRPKAGDLPDFIDSAGKVRPADEPFVLTRQIRRPAASISSNIAECSSRLACDDDDARLLEIVAAPIFEGISQSFVARRQSLLSVGDRLRLYRAAPMQSHVKSPPPVPGCERALLPL
jgi:four helix bundle protein